MKKELTFEDYCQNAISYLRDASKAPSPLGMLLCAQERILRAAALLGRDSQDGSRFEEEDEKIETKPVAKRKARNHVERCKEEPVDCSDRLVEEGNYVRSTALFDEEVTWIGLVKSVGKRGPNLIEVALMHPKEGKVISSAAFLWEVLDHVCPNWETKAKCDCSFCKGLRHVKE